MTEDQRWAWAMALALYFLQLGILIAGVNEPIKSATLSWGSVIMFAVVTGSFFFLGYKAAGGNE